MDAAIENRKTSVDDSIATKQNEVEKQAQLSDLWVQTLL